MALQNGYNLLFRNLDATAKLLAEVDLRGKTIVNTSKCTGYSMLGQMGVQKFTTMLTVDGVDFYKVDSSFGWFLPAVFEKQVGLDNGKHLECWHVINGHALQEFALPTEEGRIFDAAALGTHVAFAPLGTAFLTHGSPADAAPPTTAAPTTPTTPLSPRQYFQLTNATRGQRGADFWSPPPLLASTRRSMTSRTRSCAETPRVTVPERSDALSSQPSHLRTWHRRIAESARWARPRQRWPGLRHRSSGNAAPARRMPDRNFMTAMPTRRSSAPWVWSDGRT